MSMTMNPFSSDAFSLVNMTQSINLIPNLYGRLNEMGLFPSEGINTSTALIEEKQGYLTLLNTRPHGSPGSVNIDGKRKMRSFSVPHIPHDGIIEPNQVQGVRKFGSSNEAETAVSVMEKRLESMRRNHAITLEFLRMGALKGVILDADFSTIYDLFDEFEKTQEVINFQLDVDTTDVKKKCLDLKRYMSRNLMGEISTGVHVLVSPDFFDNLTNHPAVKTAYERWQDGAALRTDMRSNFVFAGVTFEEYDGEATNSAGTTVQFIASNEAHAFPVGTANAFKTFFAPADFMETVNTIGLELYAKQESAEFNRGVKIHTQSNPLPMCMRPELLVKITGA